MKTQATSSHQRLHALLGELEAELLDFWEDDGRLILALPEQAICFLLADYLKQRDHYRKTIRRDKK